MNRFRIFRHLAAVSLATVLCAAPSRSQATAQQTAAQGSLPDRAAIDSGRAIILRGLTRAGTPGASVTVMRNGQTVWSEGLGLADVENRVPVTTLTKFRIGSVSKSLTASAVGLLVESGKLDLDAPVQRYVPSFPEKRYPITTRQVAGHLAGIRHYVNDEFLSARHYKDVTESLNIFANDSLLFRPGDRYSYSTYGFVLVSAVVEGAAREPFLAFMQRRVLDPAGMRNTVAEFPDSLIPNRARFYTRSDSLSPTVNAPYVDQSNKWAGGGYLSNTEDLARFGDAMITGKIVKPATLDLLWTSQRTNDGKATGYGIGWVVATDSAGRQVVRHSGGSDGGTALLVLYPKQRMVFAFLFNSDGPQPPLQRVIDLFVRGR
ncbi:MAG: serine hydrolase domain-containing protein [Gemmatimonadaceae bacterium]|jgi:serine beta-lactamase-like protein LACTB